MVDNDLNYKLDSLFLSLGGPDEENELKYKPDIYPKKLIKKERLDQLIEEGKLKGYMLVTESRGDQKWASIEGKLCLNLCHYEHWRINNKRFNKWLKKLQHPVNEDGIKIAYFNYYCLYY